MKNTNPKNVDLNLFFVFDAIYREGNITKAANRQGLTQSAVSHAWLAAPPTGWMYL